MTIKIIQHEMAGKKEKTERPMTHLFGCERAHYKDVNFENGADFIEKYNKTVEGLGDTLVIGIPDEYWKDDKIAPNVFLCIYYSVGDHPCDRCIILQNSTIYIMQGGQTIDKIEC